MTGPHPRPDAYEVLGIEQDASSADISRAYRRLARELHPDSHPDDTGAEDRFRAVTGAYELLSDPTRRAAYDRRAERRSVSPAAEATPGMPWSEAGSQVRPLGPAYGSGWTFPPSATAAVRAGPVRIDPLPGRTVPPGEAGDIWLAGLMQLISSQAFDESYWAW